MYPTDLPTPTDVRTDGPGCPDCGSQWGHPDLAHGVPAWEGEQGDRSLSGLLCTVRWVQRALQGDQPGAEGETDPDYLADLLGQALGRFTGQE